MSINRITLTLFIIALSFVALFSLANNGWGAFTQIESGEYCEYTDYEALVRQPVNTVSNIPFLIFGTAILFIWWKDRNFGEGSTLLGKHYHFSLMLGIVTILAGVTSMLFHGGYVDWTKTLDSTLVLGVAGTVVLVLLRLTQEDTVVIRPFWYDKIIIILGSILLTAFTLIDQDAAPSVVVLLFIGMVLVHKLYTNHNYFNVRHLVLAFIFLGTGFALRQLDTHKIVCDPYSVLQLHALWHILTAMSIWYFYKFLHSIK